MKRIALLVFGVGLLAGTASAQAPTDAITTPVLALPANLREMASVVKWKPDQTYDVLKMGTNGLVCYDRSGFPLQAPFSLECTAMANLPRVVQNLKIEATAGDRPKANAAVAAAEKDGTRVKPVFGGVWYHLMGAEQATARTHFTIAVPGATAASMGLPDNGRSGGVWIMNAGTSTAHLMTPGE